MPWRSCRHRTVSLLPPRDFQVRGLTAPPFLIWPSCSLNESADYNIDFGAILRCDDRIVEVAFATSGGTIAWSSMFGTLATAWISWTVAGSQTVDVTVRTSGGQILTASINIAVQGAVSLISFTEPDLPPNAITLGGVPFPDASGSPLVTG